MGSRVPLVGLLAVLALPASAGGVQENPMTIRIDPNRQYQTLEHFGVSAAWWAQEVGAWPAADLDRVCDLFFDQGRGIGLTLVRYNLGGGKESSGISDPWRSAESPLTSDGRLDWSRDAAAVRVIDEAVRRGAQVLVFTNSPPAALTVTGKTTGNRRETNLPAENRPAFARFLADSVQSLAADRGWPVVAVSPINEPQWDWQPSKGQEGSFYSPEEAAALVQAVVAEFRRRGMTTPVSAVDSGEWKLSSNIGYLAALRALSDLEGALTPYAVHSYWSDSDDREALVAYLKAHDPGKRLWQTEWTEMKGGRDLGMDSALVLAKTVHEDLVIGGVTSWQYWIGASKYDFRDGLLDVAGGPGGLKTTKRLWALGNWSRFVRPGAVRLAADTPPDSTLLVSAFRNADGGLATVVVNPTEESVPLQLKTPRPGGLLSVVETSAFRDLEPVYAGPPVDWKLAPRSVTTFVHPPTP